MHYSGIRACNKNVLCMFDLQMGLLQQETQALSCGTGASSLYLGDRYAFKF